MGKVDSCPCTGHHKKSASKHFIKKSRSFFVVSEFALNSTKILCLNVHLFKPAALLTHCEVVVYILLALANAMMMMTLTDKYAGVGQLSDASRAGLQQVRQSLPQPRPRRWRHADHPPSLLAVRTRGQFIPTRFLCLRHRCRPLYNVYAAALCFRVFRPWVCPCVPKTLLVRYPGGQWREFHQTLADFVVTAKDELIRFKRPRGHDQSRYMLGCE